MQVVWPHNMFLLQIIMFYSHLSLLGKFIYFRQEIVYGLYQDDDPKVIIETSLGRILKAMSTYA